MKRLVADRLMRKIERDYNRICSDFSRTRERAWYEFKIYKEFVQRNSRILDVGCGNGRLFSYLSSSRIDYTGIDLCKSMIEIAKDRCLPLRSSSRPKFRVGNLVSIPFKKPTFDYVFSVASFHHVPSRHYRMKALSEMARVLRKDGTLVISVWNLWSRKYGKYILKSILRAGKYDFKDCFIPWGKTGVDRYYHAFSVFEMRGLLEEAGFYIQSEIYVNTKGITEKFWESENLIFLARKRQ